MAFENRIVGEGLVNPAEIMKNPKNWRLHSQHQKDALKAMLREVGWVDDVKVNKTTNLLVDGHLRVEVALEEGEDVIPVKWVDLTPAEADLVLLTFDPIAALAGADESRLQTLLDEANSDNSVVNALLADLRAEHISTETTNDDGAFQEFDEGIDTEHTCPRCGYAWSGKSK